MGMIIGPPRRSISPDQIKGLISGHRSMLPAGAFSAKRAPVKLAIVTAMDRNRTQIMFLISILFMVLKLDKAFQRAYISFRKRPSDSALPLDIHSIRATRLRAHQVRDCVLPVLPQRRAPAMT